MAKHYVSQKPSKSEKIWKVELTKNGDGERVSNDWESKEGLSMVAVHHRQNENNY